MKLSLHVQVILKLYALPINLTKWFREERLNVYD